jgi:hypothetical protein
MAAFAVQEYRESGRDVHMFDENEVALDGSGAPYDEVVSAIQERGVTDVAIMGYSHGGGSTYNLSWRLEQNTIAGSGITDITNPFAVPFTGYIDAIKNFYILDDTPEDRRPRMSIFHCAQYQRNSHLPPFLVGTESDGDIDIDQSALGVTHMTIDDHATVQGILRTHLRLWVSP